MVTVLLLLLLMILLMILLFRWYLNNQILDGKTSKTLTLSPLNRTLHAAILKCAARNKIGRSEETHTLEVSPFSRVFFFSFVKKKIKIHQNKIENRPVFLQTNKQRTF